VGTPYVGTSGYVYRDWRGRFYPQSLPQRECLGFYAERFDTVEINATFYGRFSRGVFERWGESTPERFRFALKGPRLITHVRRLREVEASLEAFLSGARGLGSKLGVVLWQFPASMRADEERVERLAAFCRLLPGDLRYAFEFRHDSWLADGALEPLRALEASLVLNDSPHLPSWRIEMGSFTYIRMHGPGELYASRYTEEQLRSWADWIRERLRERDVYVYFNNDVRAYAVENAATLRGLL